ncbi:MAG TPA: hypothetical protein VNQ73_03585 [Ilumatobacter sp.]|nr:hypothetical protein [Ilumatobacter sp.]
MLVATVLALSSAVLHAGWNLVAKRSGDPFLALWSQFLLAGLIGAVVLVAGGGMPSGAWPWALLSAGAHVPYVVALGWAYHHGDFSLAYPIARGGGALLAAIGGVVLLGDELRPLSFVAIGVVVGGMWLLASGAHLGHVLAALTVAASISVYTVSDSHAVREYDTRLYLFAGMLATGLTASVAAVVMGRGRDLLTMTRPQWEPRRGRRGDDHHRLRAGTDRRAPRPGGLRRRVARVERADRRVRRPPHAARVTRPAAAGRGSPDRGRSHPARDVALTVVSTSSTTLSHRRSR